MNGLERPSSADHGEKAARAEAIADLQRAVILLREPLSEDRRRGGWTPSKNQSLLDLLEDWLADLQGSDHLEVRHFRAIVRWFFDNEVDTDGRIGRLVSEADIRISDIVAPGPPTDSPTTDVR
jgi:hypothetical protein